MKKKEKISGFILAGGKSSRMGFDKGLLVIKSKRMIEMVAAALSGITSNITILSNNDAYNYLGLPVHKDIYPGNGPLGGIYTALKISGNNMNLIVSCDMPYINEGLLRFIIAKVGDYEIVVPSCNNIINPLCGIYKKDVAENIHNLMTNRVLKMQDVIQFFNYLVLPVGKEHDFYRPSLLKNINFPVEPAGHHSKKMYAV